MDSEEYSDTESEQLTVITLGPDEDSEEDFVIIKPSKSRIQKVLEKIGSCCLCCIKLNSKTIYRMWFFVIFSTSMYCIYTIPFRIAFFEEEILWWTLVEVIIDIVLMIDMIVSCCVPYHRKYELKSWSKTCPTYLFRGSCCDMIAFFPIYPLAFILNAIIGTTNPDSDFVFLSAWFKINRLAIFYRFSTYFRQVKDYVVKSVLRINPIITDVFRFILYVALIAHYFACLFYFIVRLENNNEAIEFAMSNRILVKGEVAFKYFSSMYWSLVTMTGYGGTLPITDVEVIFSIVTVFIGVLIYVTVIGIVGSMITNLDTAATAYRNKVDTMNDYMKFRRLDRPTQKSIRKYYHYLWSTRRGMDEAKIMSSLPEFLRLDVSRRLNRDMLRNFHFFAESSDGFIRGILVRLIPKTVYPDSHIIKQGEIGKEMFFLTKGVVDIFVKGLPKAVATLNAVTYFGEAALLTGNKRNASIVAKGFCDMWVLKQKDFDEICSLYKEEKDRIWGIHKERMKKTEEEKKEKEMKEAEEEAIRVEEERVEQRRRQKEEERKRIERLKREKAIVFEKRKKRKTAAWKRRRMMKRSMSSGGSIGMRRKGKHEIWAQTREVM